MANKERELQGVIASMRFEGMEPTEKEIAIARRRINGEITAEQAKKEMLALHQKL